MKKGREKRGEKWGKRLGRSIIIITVDGEKWWWCNSCGERFRLRKTIPFVGFGVGIGVGDANHKTR